jgi:nicotinic acid mononucleotide adenylyltransferase
MKTNIDLIAHMLVMKTLAPTLGAEKYIAMLVHMSVLHKTKSYNKIVTKRIAMPTMGVTTNPKTKVLKFNLGKISDAILAMTNVEEETHNMIKMKEPTMSLVNNLDKIFNNTIAVNQVKLASIFNANPMLWLAGEDLLSHLKPQEMKASVLAEETWRMKRTCMASSSSTCPSSKVKTTPKLTSHGHSRWTRSSASTTTPVPRKWLWHHSSLKTTPTLGGSKSSLSEKRRVNLQLTLGKI